MKIKEGMKVELKTSSRYRRHFVGGIATIVEIEEDLLFAYGSEYKWVFRVDDVERIINEKMKNQKQRGNRL